MMYDRQNDPENIKLLRAAEYCTRMERGLKMIPTILSLAVCLAGIANHYQSFMDPLWFAFIAGLILMVDAVLFTIGSRFQKLSATCMDIYDHRVYDIPSNKLMTKHMTLAQIDQYARRVKERKSKHHNYYWATNAEATKSYSTFLNQHKQFTEEYKLLQFSRLYLYTAWIAFLVGLVAISFVINDTFINTIGNIFIPSLGLIMLILNSFITFEENMSDIRNCLSSLEKKKEEHNKGIAEQNLRSNAFLRTVQDSVYKFRSQNITIPTFVYLMYRSFDRIRTYEEKKLAKKHGGSYATSDTLRVPRKKKKKEERAAKKTKKISGTGTKKTKPTKAKKKR